MKEIRVEVPDTLAREIDLLVKDGWFLSEGELARHAITEFVRHHRPALHEQFLREDIAWALRQRKTGA